MFVISKAGNFAQLNIVWGRGREAMFAMKKIQKFLSTYITGRG